MNLSGVNGFRLMPDDPLQEFPATASLSTAAGGHLTVFTYTWQHPDDGPQDGLLLISASTPEPRITGVWGDSWHQKPELMTLVGTRAADGEIALEGTYGGDWGWRILIAVDTGGLRMRMENVVPGSGAYPVMVLHTQQN